MNVDRTAEPAVEELVCDLCILGAGIAGLNALFVASRYLSRNQKVVLVDRNPRVGGMWLSAYDYVRLHQPHPMFTAGNIAWTSVRDPSYLATRSEVVAHLDHCRNTLAERVNCDERYGYEYRSHDEGSAGSDEVLVDCTPVSGNGRPLRIKAKKLIKAFGYNIETKDALELSSTQVRSVSPDHDDLLGAEMRASKAPVYIIGGGKTGMDTAYALITHFPGRQVNLLIGQGTIFLCRDQIHPSGLSRFWTGSTPVATFLDLARHFDGRNERELPEYLRSSYGISLVPDARRFMLGFLSRQENAVIAAGVHEIIKDYFADVVDRDGQPTLVLKSGQSRPIEPGSVIVNCTGYLSAVPSPYEPYISEGGRVLCVHPPSAIHVLSTCSSYLATHLFYLDRLGTLPLYELDLPGLYAADREAFSATIGPHVLYNAGLILGALPRNALDEFGTDTERWYPMHRQLVDGIKLALFNKLNPHHLKRSLDTIRERFGVRCGPLPHVLRAENPQRA
jgi:hypothetical protein